MRSDSIGQILGSIVIVAIIAEIIGNAKVPHVIANIGNVFSGAVNAVTHSRGTAEQPGIIPDMISQSTLNAIPPLVPLTQLSRSATPMTPTTGRQR